MSPIFSANQPLQSQITAPFPVLNEIDIDAIDPRHSEVLMSISGA